MQTNKKIAPFRAHFGRIINTTLSNITTKSSTNNLPYKNIKSFYLDKKRVLKQAMLNSKSIWKLELDSKPQLDIRFQDEEPGEESASTQSTLQNLRTKSMKRNTISPTEITPYKLMVTFGDKTTTITTRKRQVARKT